MKKKYLFSLLVSCFLIGKQTIAQQNSKPEKDITVNIKSLEVQKTIQIMFLTTDKDKLFGLTNEIIKKIEGLRTQSTIAYLEVSETCRVKILPKNTINQKDFKPLEEYVIVEKFEN